MPVSTRQTQPLRRRAENRHLSVLSSSLHTVSTSVPRHLDLISSPTNQCWSSSSSSTGTANVLQDAPCASSLADRRKAKTGRLTQIKLLCTDLQEFKNVDEQKRPTSLIPLHLADNCSLSRHEVDCRSAKEGKATPADDQPTLRANRETSTTVFLSASPVLLPRFYSQKYAHRSISAV